MKIGIKLAVGFLVVVLLIWVVVYFSISTYTEIYQEYEILEGEIIPGVTSLREMEEAANEANRSIIYYTISGLEGDRLAALSALEELESLGLESLELETSMRQEEQVEAEELMATIDAFALAAVELIGLKEQGGSNYESLAIQERVVRARLDILLGQIRGGQATHVAELIASGVAVNQARIHGMRLSLIVAGSVTRFRQ